MCIIAAIKETSKYKEKQAYTFYIPCKFIEEKKEGNM